MIKQPVQRLQRYLSQFNQTLANALLQQTRTEHDVTFAETWFGAAHPCSLARELASQDKSGGVEVEVKQANHQKQGFPQRANVLNWLYCTALSCMKSWQNSNNFCPMLILPNPWKNFDLLNISKIFKNLNNPNLCSWWKFEKISYLGMICVGTIL